MQRAKTSSGVRRRIVGAILASLIIAAPLSAGDVPGWKTHVITDLYDEATSVLAVDLDADGDMDVLATSSAGDTVGWFESDGAATPTFTEHVLSTSARDPRAVQVADLDGDGDLDVMSAALIGDTVAWHENDGGSPPVFTMHVVSTEVWGVWDIHPEDLDGDGDTDMVIAAVLHQRVSWFENVGGTPPEFVFHEISNNVKWAQAVHTADLDGDEDPDILSASRQDGKVMWFENNGGDPLVLKPRRIEIIDGAKSVYAADLDGDADNDVLAAARFIDTVFWYENLGGTPPDFLERVISDEADQAMSVFATDMDGDGDVDVLSASLGNDQVLWYENDGLVPPTLARHIVTKDADGATSVHAIDVDADGDVDVLSSSWYDDTIAWYEKIGLGMSVTGLDGVGPAAVTGSCANLATGARADSSSAAPSDWVCDRVGVTAERGEEVRLSLVGRATGAETLGGSVVGLSGASLSVTCRNLTSFQSVALADASGAWDCEAGGLRVAGGDRVEVVVHGTP